MTFTLRNYRYLYTFVNNILMRNICLYFRSFTQEIDLSGLQVDMALRKFQSFFRMPVGDVILLQAIICTDQFYDHGLDCACFI